MRRDTIQWTTVRDGTRVTSDDTVTPSLNTGFVGANSEGTAVRVATTHQTMAELSETSLPRSRSTDAIPYILHGQCHCCSMLTNYYLPGANRPTAHPLQVSNNQILKHHSQMFHAYFRSSTVRLILGFATPRLVLASKYYWSSDSKSESQRGGHAHPCLVQLDMRFTLCRIFTQCTHLCRVWEV
jgi:hypothetical protein